MIRTWLKAFVLTFALVFTVGAIYKLKNNNEFMDSMGLLFYGVDSKKQVDWCKTRVNEIEVPGKFRVFQEGMKWYREEKGTTTELGFIPVEKWFSNHCRLSAEGKTEGFATDFAGPNQVVLARVGFIDGHVSLFKEISQGIFTWGNEVTFRSEQLQKAISDLEELPVIGGSEKGKAPGH